MTVYFIQGIDGARHYPPPMAADFWTIASAIGTLLGAFLATIALVVAIRALRATDRAAKVAEQQLAMARVEHDAFLRKLTARPEPHVTFEVDGLPTFDQQGRPTAFRAVDATAAWIRVAAGVSNTGDVDFRSPLLTFLVPQQVQDLRHVDHRGLEVDRQLFDAPTTAELLAAVDGDEGPPAQYVTVQLDDLPPDGVTHRRFASFSVNVPTDGELVVPMRLKVSSPDLPRRVDNTREEWLELVLRIARRPQEGWPAGAT